MNSGTTPNKWVMFALSLLTTLIGFALSFDWTSLFSSHTAGIVVTVVGLIKMLSNAFMPSTGTALTAPATATPVTKS